MKIEKQVLWRPERITERMCYMIANLVNMVLFVNTVISWPTDFRSDWLLNIVWKACEFRFSIPPEQWWRRRTHQRSYHKSCARTPLAPCIDLFKHEHIKLIARNMYYEVKILNKWNPTNTLRSWSIKNRGKLLLQKISTSRIFIQ